MIKFVLVKNTKDVLNMKQIIKKIIKNVFGTENNILLKIHLSMFISGVLFFIFAIMVKEVNSQANDTFTLISAVLFSIWIILTQGSNPTWEIIKEFIRLFACFIILIFSLEFCIISVLNSQGYKLIILAVLSCLGIVFCSFYLISKFIDIFNFFKNSFKKIKEKLFDSVQPATSKTKALLENITAFLVSIAGLGVAIKAIIEPLINLFR